MKIKSLVGVFLLSIFCLGARASEEAQNIRVVWSTSPQTEAVVVWDGETVDEAAVLLYDTVSRKDGRRNYASTSPVAEAGLYKEEAPDPNSEKVEPVTPDLFYHHAKLTRLTPDTLYYLAVKTAEGIGREFHFKTAPQSDKPFKLIYAGDSRSRLNVTRAISGQISEMIAEDDTIIALLHGGDYAGMPKRDMWKAWLEAYALTTTDDGKLLPIIPVVGNHERPSKSPIFRQAYGYPGGEEDYYLCRLTPSVAILLLNTETRADGAQRDFLQKALATLKKEKVYWQVAAYHKPFFPAIKGPAAAKASWVPLFEKFNIDLALESDGHCIKRTVPIRGDKEADDGIVYIGEGGYGAPQRAPKLDRWYIQGDNAFASKGDHIMMLEFTPEAINYSVILNTGEIIDSASFKSHR